MVAIIGCKWSLTVCQLLDEGINRPGETVRTVEGLSTKVLNQCPRRNMVFGILEKISYPEVPPRVEYAVTPVRHEVYAGDGRPKNPARRDCP